MRRIIVSLSSLLVAAAVLVTAAPAAFAMRLHPLGGDSPGHVAPAVHHPVALAPWQDALIAIASLLILAAALVLAHLVRRSHRTAPTPATT
jgi:hypothetical protein